MMGFGLGGFGFVFMLLFWVGIVVLALWVVGAFFPNGRSVNDPRLIRREDVTGRDEPSGPSALEIARQRYAGGEISREEYHEIVGTLAGPGESRDGAAALREVSSL